MSPTRLLWSCLVVVSLTAATCSNNGKPEEGAKAPAPAAPAPAPVSAAKPAVPEGSGGSGDDEVAQVLRGIPGMDFSSLPGPAQTQLAHVLTDEFCYCGCPHTIAQCLKGHASCRHAKRMVQIAAPEAQMGADSDAIINQLKKYYVSFTEPRATNLKVDERMCKGPKDAKITMVEFADFECPFCGAARPKIEAFEKTAQGQKVKVCMIPFPLNAHPNAIPAGQAALYARDHGKFWPMHDALFENQFALSPQAIVELATKIGLNGKELEKVFADKKYVDELMANRQMGIAATVDSTPTIFVNGRKLALLPETDFLQLTTEDELERMANNNNWQAD